MKSKTNLKPFNCLMNKGSEPITEKAFLELYHPRLYPCMLKAGLQKQIRQGFQKIIGQPIEDLLFRLWLNDSMLGKQVEKMGLPRRGVGKHYNHVLCFEANPCSLNKLVTFKNKFQRRSLGNRFIWDGDWDKKIRHFHDTKRFLFLADIWENRLDLTKSRRFQEMVHMYKQGRPYKSYHKGVYLDNDQKVHRFLEIYLTFMKQLEQYGYNTCLSNDPVGVAIDRTGALVKINKGLHRLAMVQIVGLKKIPVLVRAVHRLWWNKNNASQDIQLKRNFSYLISRLSN